VIDRREELGDIALQQKRAWLFHPSGQTIKGGVRAFALPARIGVVNECTIKYRLDDGAKSMMQNPVSIRWRSDNSRLWVPYVENMIWSRTPLPRKEIGLQPEEVRL
jgi:hypothetical protein